MSSAISYRFEVALSFPSEYRSRVEHIADILAANLGRDHVLYDAWYREEFARANLDVYLPDIYRKQSRLLVFFFCKEYAAREWTGLEWRAGRDLLKQRQDERLMFLRFDDADIPGLYSGDGYIDIAKLPDDAVAADILKRLNRLAPAPRASIETTVQSLRVASEPTIRERCGRIRVLSMERAVDLGSVYTNVLMLAKRTINQLKTRDELVRDAQRDEFDRFGLSSGQTQRIEGTRAFDTERRVIIYGKPGSGKTTFLKHLAMECSTGSFRAELVPVFITLRDYADTPARHSLCQYVEEQWQMNLNSRTVLNHGLALILLDGLDEVRNRDFTRVRHAIEEFAREFPLNTIALTCRIAAREYTFESFTEVEMADFDEKQITWFASRWFTAHNERRKSESFVEKLKSNPPVWELASNPLLLTLLCLVFQDRNDFDGTRADLYKQALDILLYRWDARRDLERDFSSGVSKAELEPLLTEIAYTRFMANEYFFEETSLHIQIDHFLRKRALARQDKIPNPAQVLNDIEANIGLLVARAVHIYSFSHLTFQEYLTAQQAVRKPSLLSDMASHISDHRWREVWILLSTMLDADDIITELKMAVDVLVAKAPAIQKMLRNCMKIAKRSPAKESAIRAFYCGLELAYSVRAADIFHTVTQNLYSDLVHESGPHLNFAIPGGQLKMTTQSVRSHEGLEASIDVQLSEITNSGSRLAALLGLGEDADCDLDKYLLDVLLRGQLVILARKGHYLGSRRFGIVSALHGTWLLAREIDSSFGEELQDCRMEFAADSSDDWSAKHYAAWMQRLRSASIRHRDIGNDWAFNERDKTLLEQYLRANKLLLECMDAARGLKTETRQFVEATMFLPWDEIPETPDWDIGP